MHVREAHRTIYSFIRVGNKTVLEDKRCPFPLTLFYRINSTLFLQRFFLDHEYMVGEITFVFQNRGHYGSTLLKFKQER